MRRVLPWLNLLGVFVLAGVCAVQWQRDRRLNLEVNRLEGVRYENEESLVRQKKEAAALQEDLTHFKGQFETAHGELRDVRAKASSLERQTVQLGAEREQLKAAVTNWAAAVKERDQRLQEVHQQLRDISLRLNDSVLKFNELASNHNATILRFNELATNYNTVVTQLNALRTSRAAR
jgi:uncharacterized coiled-coil DUF342 family protein